jgi:hypothetical protein
MITNEIIVTKMDQLVHSFPGGCHSVPNKKKTLQVPVSGAV